MENIGNARVAADEVGVTRVLGEYSNGFVKGDIGQRTGGDLAQEILVIFEMLGAIASSGCKPRIIVEWVVGRLEVGGAIFPVVYDLAFLAGVAPPVCHREVPAAGVPHPTHVVGG